MIINIFAVIGALCVIELVVFAVWIIIDEIKDRIHGERERKRYHLLPCPHCGFAPEVLMNGGDDKVKLRCCRYETAWHDYYVKAVAEWNKYVKSEGVNV